MRWLNHLPRWLPCRDDGNESTTWRRGGPKGYKLWTSIFFNRWFGIFYLATMVYNVAIKGENSLYVSPAFMSPWNLWWGYQGTWQFEIAWVMDKIPSFTHTHTHTILATNTFHFLSIYWVPSRVMSILCVSLHFIITCGRFYDLHPTDGMD